MKVLESLIDGLRARCGSFPDKRTGGNCQYAMADIGLAAFSIFFMQSPSFLAHQRALEGGRGRSNCQGLFGIGKIPTDNHIRDMLDPVAPDALFGLFTRVVAALEDGGGLADFRRLVPDGPRDGPGGGHLLVALDGTEYFRSAKLHCPRCSQRKRQGGGVEYYHGMVSATLVAPGHDRAVPLAPAFITPQDGHDKQDCESRAARRWLAEHGPGLAALGPIYLGDDLYSRQPICQAVQAVGGHFLFVAKPSSHVTLWQWLDGIELPTRQRRVKQGRHFVTHRYRWLNDVAIRDGADALAVNWFEIEITNLAGRITYRNSFITDLGVSADNVAELAACGRARWKIENEAFNVLKTKGYHLEHNFGHGSQNLAALLATMNLLAFAFHTVCDLVEKTWQDARQALAARTRFFEHLRTVTVYHIFPDWAALIRTLIDGEPPPVPAPP